MAHKYQIGDVLRSKTGKTATVKNLRCTPSAWYSTEDYQIMVHNGPYAGRLVPRSKANLEDAQLFTLIGGPSFIVAPPPLPNIDIDEAMFAKISAETVEILMRHGESCDCGGHKCGYRDDELHAHARWCKLVELSQGAKNVR